MGRFPEIEAGFQPTGDIGSSPIGSAGVGLPVGIGIGAEYNNYAVSGTVKEDNVLRPGYIVRMYRRDTGALLDSTVTDASGSFMLSTMGFPGFVFVVAFDEIGALNALIYDQVIPS